MARDIEVISQRLSRRQAFLARILIDTRSFFEHLTFQVFDAPDLKVNVYTPLDEADTPVKLSRLLSERASVSSGF
jgi:hypothetical protein